MARSFDEIAAGLSESDRARVAEKIAELDRKIEHQQKFDAAVVDSLLRILRSRLGKELRSRLKEIANG